MNVKQLKKLLEDVPDDAQVLLSGHDHSYRKGSAVFVTVEHLGRDYLEWYDEANSSGGKPEKHLVIT